VICLLYFDSLRGCGRTLVSKIVRVPCCILKSADPAPDPATAATRDALAKACHGAGLTDCTLHMAGPPSAHPAFPDGPLGSVPMGWLSRCISGNMAPETADIDAAMKVCTQQWNSEKASRAAAETDGADGQAPKGDESERGGGNTLT